MEYLDYESEVMTGGFEESELFSCFHKRKGFEYERELRLGIQDFKPAKSQIIYVRPSHRSRIYVSVDLGSLIERIYLVPSCPTWQFGLLKSVTRSYGLNSEVIRSGLNEKPAY